MQLLSLSVTAICHMAIVLLSVYLPGLLRGQITFFLLSEVNHPVKGIERRVGEDLNTSLDSVPVSLSFLRGKMKAGWSLSCPW